MAGAHSEGKSLLTTYLILIALLLVLWALYAGMYVPIDVDFYLQNIHPKQDEL
ncbi:hypothetical protein YQE_06128, partial [Dendroctonus ponderosae]